MTGSKMAKAVLVEQQRLSGAITGSNREVIMTKTNPNYQAREA